ncbi:MAG: hypothetical protein KA100_03765 [Rickettsiales bacterium]|nr:hypothetical protein [Rickettsiales bacterium]
MKLKLVIFAILLTLLSGCSSYRESLGQYNLPTTNIPTPTREGRVCYYNSDLRFWTTDIDFTVETARRNAGITNIVAIEKEKTGNFLLRRKCLIVRGN